MCFLFPPSFPKDHEVPDAVVPVVARNESVLDVDDDPAAADDRTLRKGRLIKGWRMGDAPTLLLRGHQDEREWGTRRTEPLRAEPKRQAQWPPQQ